jgi:hypothetical protein
LPRQPTHCPQEHEYTEEHTYVDKAGYRHCKTCRRERMRARRPASGVGTGGRNAEKTHCPKNHEYTEENTSWQKAPTTKGYRRVCRTCAKMNGALQNLKRYSMTPEKLQEMMEAQRNKCLICPRTFAEFVPHIDHDHTCCPGGSSCGKCIRGLLCVDCNRGLGSFRDDPDLLRAAAVYLDR